MNRNEYTGRLTKDVEISYVGQKNTKTARYTIAVQDDYNPQNVDFINCQSFGKAVDYLEKYGKKGTYIEFSGKLHTYNKDGNYGYTVVSDTVKLIFANSKPQDEQEQPNGNNETEEDKPF